MPASLTDRWSLASDAAPALVLWDDEFVAHHALSNDTHRLSWAAGRILQSLSAACPREVRQLMDDIGLATPEVEAALQALAELGFVSRC